MARFAMRVVIARQGVPDRVYQVTAVPRAGDLIRTPEVAAARVTEVVWDYGPAPEGHREVVVHAR